MSLLNWSRLLLLSLLWGGSFLFSAVALKGWPVGAGNGLPPMTAVLIRVVVASLTLMIILRIMGVALPRDRRIWIAFAGMGLLNNIIPFNLFFWGQGQLPASVAAGLASILNATTPLFTVVVAHVLTSDEKATPLKAVGVLIGLVGVAAMMGADALSQLGVSTAGQLACLASAFVYALAGTYGRRFKTLGVTPVQTAFGQVSASAVIMLPLAFVADQPWGLPTPGAIPFGAIVAMGVVSTAFAYILFFQILASAGATNIALVTFLIPVSAILLGFLVLGEALKPQHFLGMACIGLSLALIDGRLFRRARTDTP